MSSERWVCLEVKQGLAHVRLSAHPLSCAGRAHRPSAPCSSVELSSNTVWRPLDGAPHRQQVGGVARAGLPGNILGKRF